MLVSEIFASINGETCDTGLPTVFVRLYGCNLKCRGCDNPEDKATKQKMTVQSIVEQVGKLHGISRVCITGGEPLMQSAETYQLIYELTSLNYKVSIETNGSAKIRDDYMRSYRYVMDVKSPSSMMHHKNRLDNLEHLQDKDEVKFVIADRNDYEYAKTVLKKYPTKAKILFSPFFNSENRQYLGSDLCNWMIEDRIQKVRLNLQIHKYINVM